MNELKSLIERADALFREKRPEYYAALLPGASEDELAAAESYYGFPLPESLKTLYRWKNGQNVQCRESFTGIDNLSFMRLKDGIEAHRIFDDLDKAGEYEEGFWDVSWVPFMDNGGGDHVCMEVNSGGAGAGLVWFYHDYEERPQPDLYSVEKILEAAIEEMESGEFDAGEF